MAVRLPARADTVPAWPNQTEAAQILGISEPTLLRRGLPHESAGAREKRYAPVTVLRAVGYFKKTTLAEAAQAVVDVAQAKYPTLVDEITEEVEQAVAELCADESRELTDDVLTELKRILPTRYHQKVESIYARGRAGHGEHDRRPSGTPPARGRLTKGPDGRRRDPRVPALARS